MKIDYNGIVRDMTPEEEEALEMDEDYEPETSIYDRVSNIENSLGNLGEVLDVLFGTEET